MSAPGEVLPATVSYPSLARASSSLAILVLAYTFSFIDRTILAMLVGPIKADLHLSDTQISLLTGLAFAILASLLVGQVLELKILIWQQVYIGAAVGILAQWGDLVESKLKRIANLKDAGSIIPGHGGILDRLDSVVVSVPTVYYLVAVVFEP